ncbi:MAG: hypothetical protein M3342_10625 [Bacteroidota bacterium]|nr:hypothetical protein [Bacteroidota bacterium]
MENVAVQQEILLVTTTTFSQREWCGRDEQDARCRLSPPEALENACWNGLLAELLPEILVKSPAGKRLILWNIRQGKSSLHLELSEFPLHAEHRYSIDASYFIPTQCIN